ncbi:MAG: hypothetical protein AB1607_05545 [Chloroflexota bacterium]
MFPVRVQAQGESEIPPLGDFVADVMNDEAEELRGLYIPGVLADAILPQLEDQPAYVSSQSDTLTQFEMASRYETIGLLAHNYLAGGDFFLLDEGQIIFLIYGNGRTETYIVREFLRYQALTPESTTSDFVDLETGDRLTSTQLFLKVFNRPGDLVLQTCIYAESDASWGRLFIIAEPYDEHEPISMPHVLEFQ